MPVGENRNRFFQPLYRVEMIMQKLGIGSGENGEEERNENV